VTTTSLLKLYRFGFGLLIFFSVISQFLTFRQTPSNFFSYFTVLSNLLLSFAFIASVLNILNQKYLIIVKGAATLYVLITGLGFTILLGGKNDEFISWINIILHFVSPIIALFDWTIAPAIKISFKTTLIWIAPLFVYFVYSMVRGYFTNWYPYSFINPAEVGVTGLLIYFVIIFISSLVISYLLIKIQNLSTLKVA
jgi:hypothetical protein